MKNNSKPRRKSFTTSLCASAGSSPPVREMVASPSPWNYRNHVQFHLTEEGKLGHMTAGAPRVFAISECYLPEGSINSLWPQLEFEPGMDIERISLRTGVDEELMMVLESDSPEPPELEIEAGISATHVFEGNTVVIAGNDHVVIRVLERDFKVSAPSFFQVNTAMTGKMVEHILENVPVSSSATVLGVSGSGAMPRAARQSHRGVAGTGVPEHT